MYCTGMRRTPSCTTTIAKSVSTDHRENPFEGGYTIAAGLEEVVRFLESLHFTRDDLDYLTTVTGNDNQRLFPNDFLRHLEGDG